MQDSTFIGLDVHKATLSIAVAPGERGGEVRHRGTVPHRPDHVRKPVGKLAAGVRPLLPDEHFPVDGTLVKAWASMKDFQPKDSEPPPPRQGPRPVHDDNDGPQPRQDTEIPRRP